MQRLPSFTKPASKSVFHITDSSIFRLTPKLKHVFENVDSPSSFNITVKTTDGTSIIKNKESNATKRWAKDEQSENQMKRTTPFFIAR